MTHESIFPSSDRKENISTEIDWSRYYVVIKKNLALKTEIKTFVQQ